MKNFDKIIEEVIEKAVDKSDLNKIVYDAVEKYLDENNLEKYINEFLPKYINNEIDYILEDSDEIRELVWKKLENVLKNKIKTWK